MSEFDIVGLDPADRTLIRSRVDAMLAVHAHDRDPLPAPSATTFLTSLVQQRRDRGEEHCLAVADGEVIGFARYHFGLLDNTHSLELDIKVRPEHRGKGVGTALLRRVEARAAAMGRTNLTAMLHRPAPDGPEFADLGAGFAAAHGYANALTLDLRYCDLDAVDQAAIESLWNEGLARSADFEVRLFEGEPDEALVEGIADLRGRVLSDSPTGEWDVREIRIDADRQREQYRILREQGATLIGAAAIHTGSGEVAGFTEIEFPAGREDSADQSDTIVDSRYRGHRLGMVLKIANQRRVRDHRPRVRRLWTGNAQDNAHMIAINEAIGYRRGALGALYQKDLR